MSPDIRIGAKLKTLREFRNLKQDAVADMLGISSSAYSRIEQNRGKLTVELAQKLAEILEVSLTDLISNDNPIISFTYKDSTVDNSPGYINNRYENSKDALDLMMKAKDEEIANLKEQNKQLQNQVNNFTSMLGDYLKGTNKQS